MNFTFFFPLAAESKAPKCQQLLSDGKFNVAGCWSLLVVAPAMLCQSYSYSATPSCMYTVYLRYAEAAGCPECASCDEQPHSSRSYFTAMIFSHWDVSKYSVHLLEHNSVVWHQHHCLPKTWFDSSLQKSHSIYKFHLKALFNIIKSSLIEKVMILLFGIYMTIIFLQSYFCAKVNISTNFEFSFLNVVPEKQRSESR